MIDSCPHPESLLAHVMQESQPAMGAEGIERHLSGCHICQTEVTAIREAAAELRMNADGISLTVDACLSDVAIAELVDGVVTEDRRARLEHVASCKRCRANVAGVARLLSAERIQREFAQLPPPTMERKRRRFAVGVPMGLAAAAALLLTVAIPSDTRVPSTQPIHRDAVLTGTPPPRTVVPSGQSGYPVVLAWTSVPLADLYEVTLFGADGAVIWIEQTTDSVALVPDSLVLRAGETYFWMVRARTGWDRWSESDLTEFAIVARPDGGH